MTPDTREPLRRDSMPAYLGAAAVLVAYLATAYVGVRLGGDGLGALVWAPSGIGLAGLLILGYRAWPIVAFGALLVNLLTGTPPAVAVGVAVGNTLETLAGASLLGRAGFDRSLARLRD